MLLTSTKNHLVSYPTPVSLNGNWAYGSLLGIFFTLQFVTGLILAMFFSPTDGAFSSVVYILSDVNYGYIVKYMHLNVVSIIFVLLYAHIFKALFHDSWRSLFKVWISGVLIFIFTILTAFLGYVLPWAQMSFWAATVITNLVTVLPLIGPKLLVLLHGGFSVQTLTLTRFFVLHFLMAVLVLVLAVIHIQMLHNGSSTNSASRISWLTSGFSFKFGFKDLQAFLAIMLVVYYLVFISPNYLNHPDNFIEANPLVTPSHIVPEWYFLPFYAMLRAVPSKIFGVVALLMALLIFTLFPLLVHTVARLWMIDAVYDYEFRKSILKYLFAYLFIILGYLGALEAVTPYTGIAMFFTASYFVVAMLLVFYDRWSSIKSCAWGAIFCFVLVTGGAGPTKKKRKLKKKKEDENRVEEPYDYLYERGPTKSEIELEMDLATSDRIDEFTKKVRKRLSRLAAEGGGAEKKEEAKEFVVNRRRTPLAPYARHRILLPVYGPITKEQHEWLVVSGAFSKKKRVTWNPYRGSRRGSGQQLREAIVAEALMHRKREKETGALRGEGLFNEGWMDKFYDDFEDELDDFMRRGNKALEFEGEKTPMVYKSRLMKGTDFTRKVKRLKTLRFWTDPTLEHHLKERKPNGEFVNDQLNKELKRFPNIRHGMLFMRKVPVPANVLKERPELGKRRQKTLIDTEKLLAFMEEKKISWETQGLFDKYEFGTKEYDEWRKDLARRGVPPYLNDSYSAEGPLVRLLDNRLALPSTYDEEEIEAIKFLLKDHRIWSKKLRLSCTGQSVLLRWAYDNERDLFDKALDPKGRYDAEEPLRFEKIVNPSLFKRNSKIAYRIICKHMPFEVNLYYKNIRQRCQEIAKANKLKSSEKEGDELKIVATDATVEVGPKKKKKYNDFDPFVEKGVCPVVQHPRVHVVSAARRRFLWDARKDSVEPMTEKEASAAPARAADWDDFWAKRELEEKERELIGAEMSECDERDYEEVSEVFDDDIPDEFALITDPEQIAEWDRTFWQEEGKTLPKPRQPTKKALAERALAEAKKAEDDDKKKK